VVIVWSKPAQEDLRLIHQYIAHDSLHYANQVVQDILTKVELLAISPRIGKLVIEIDDEDVRELHIYSWRILYEVKRTDITVHALVHKRMNFIS
jgi:plasmid stabilization system protein ParE